MSLLEFRDALPLFQWKFISHLWFCCWFTPLDICFFKIPLEETFIYYLTQRRSLDRQDRTDRNSIYIFKNALRLPAMPNRTHKKQVFSILHCFDDSCCVRSHAKHLVSLREYIWWHTHLSLWPVDNPQQSINIS